MDPGDISKLMAQMHIQFSTPTLRTKVILTSKTLALINALSKLIEKMINKLLIWTLKSTKPLSKEQCGFRKNHSTVDALSILYTDICSAFRCLATSTL